MQRFQQTRVRDALRRLTESLASPTAAVGVPMPLFARAPYIAVLWAATLAASITLLGLGRVQIPRIARGTVIAVPTDAGPLTLLLLLPASSRPFVAAGQRAEVEIGHGKRLVLSAAQVEPELLDAPTAHERFAGQPALLAQVKDPQVAVRLAPCGPRGCLTPNAGDTYPATAAIGTRSLASFAVPGS